MRAAIHAVNEIVYCGDNPMTMDELRTVGASQVRSPDPSSLFFDVFVKLQMMEIGVDVDVEDVEGK